MDTPDRTGAPGNPRIFARRLAWFAVLSVLDFLMTWVLLQRQGDEVFESNPIADWWLQRYGWVGLAIFKALCVFLAAGLFLVVVRYRPRTGVGALNCACAAVMLVVVYSCCLYWLTKPDSEWAAANEMAHRLDDQVQECRHRQEVLLRLSHDLVDKRRTLTDAVEALSEAHLDEDPIMRRALSTQYADRPAEQGLALYLARLAVDLVAGDRRAAGRVAKQLEKEFRSSYQAPSPPLQK
jgi:hypothetical protein